MKEWNKAFLLIAGLIVHGCAAVGIVFLFNKTGILFKCLGLIAVLSLLLSMWWLIHSLEE